VIPVAAAAAAGGAVLAGAVIGVVCWKRRSRRNACKTKLVATAGRAPVDPDTLPKYEYPDINLLELAPMTPKGNTASGRVSGVGPSETAYSVLGQQRAVYTENVSYTSLARDRHRTYTQTSEMMLPGQIFAAAAAAVAYEEPVPTRRFTRHERPSTATPQGSKVNPTFFHSFSDDEQTAWRTQCFPRLWKKHVQEKYMEEKNSKGGEKEADRSKEGLIDPKILFQRNA
jgi:hypothetical protein